MSGSSSSNGMAYAAAVLTSVLLTAAVVLHSINSLQTSYDDEPLSPMMTRKLWHDSWDPLKRASDATLPENLRGVPSERIHYMESIAPKSDHEWYSVCYTHEIELSEGFETEDAFSGLNLDVNPAQTAKSAHLAQKQQKQADVAKEHARRSEEAVLAKKEHNKRLAKGEAGKVGLRFTRDRATGMHSYAAQHGHNHAAATLAPKVQRRPNPWMHNPLGFKRHPRRNPAEACTYSASYRAANADECASVNKNNVGMGTLEAPFKESKFVLKAGKDTACAAVGWFSNDILASGWNYLHVESNPLLDNEAQARAAGFLEGALTTQQIYEHHTNEFQVLFPPNGVIDDLTKGFLNDMTNFNLQMVASQGSTDPYWMQVGLLYQQLQGLFEGYNSASTDPDKAISYFDLICLQYDGDMSDIQATVAPSTRVSTSDPLQKIMEYLIRNGHCSALIKLTEGNTELFAAHDTWAGFSSTHRMFKAYKLPFSNVSSTTIQFSSYPAFLASTDDWYQMLESQLTVLETTNDIVNTTLYNYVDSSSVGTWARAVVASRLAQGGPDWCGYFGFWQSGTYNNQWMVVDYSIFQSGAQLQNNTLWILEIMPGSVYSLDVTNVLQKHMYWASYNRPYINPVYVAMGYATLNETYGPYLFGYDRYFRGEIYKREQVNIYALLDMQRTQSLNKWQTDPWSHNNSGFAISSRFDLSTYDPVPSLGFFYRGAWGAYDVKVTASAWNQGVGNGNNTLRVSTISGPTHWDQPVFTWSDPEWTNYSSHIGLPNTYDFDFLQFYL